jgi:hypothetical protein
MDINNPKDKEVISISESSSVEIDNNEVEECFDNFNRHLSEAYVRYRKQAKYASETICFRLIGGTHYHMRICEIPETYSENSYYEYVKKGIEKFARDMMGPPSSSIILQCMIHPSVFHDPEMRRRDYVSDSELDLFIDTYKVFFQIMIPPVRNGFCDTRESLKMYLKHVIDLFEECGGLHLLQSDYKTFKQYIDSVLSDYPDILEIIEILEVGDMMVKPAK